MSLVTSAYFRIFEPFLAFNAESREETTKALRAARIGMFPEWYLSLSYVSAFGLGTAGAVTSGLFLAGLGLTSAWLAIALAVAIGIAAFTLVRLGFLLYPRIVAAGRASRIDNEFPSVIVLCYALARGGMPIVEVFRSLADEKETYGDISDELGLVVRDIEWLGYDLNTALQNVSKTTPSNNFRGFLDGLVTIMNSGANPQDYFKRQADAQMAEAEVTMQKELDQAGLLAEVYVSGLLVLPLLLIVILSVLSALGGGTEGFVPIIVFGLIPLGTIGYLLILELLLPPGTLSNPAAREQPLEDFGLDVAPPEVPVLPPPKNLSMRDLEKDLVRDGVLEADSKGLRRRVFVEWLRRRARTTWHEFKARVIVKPVDAIELSGVAALLILITGMALFWYGGRRGHDLIVAGTSLLFTVALVALIPVGIFHEIRLKRARRVEKALPDMLAKLSGFNERGIGILQAFQILGRSATGPLAGEMRAVERDVSWNGNLIGALGRMRGRVNTLLMTKVTVLFERACRATGNMKEVLDIAAADSSRMENLRSQRQQSMMSYVVVVYVVFAVFLYVVYMTVTLFYGPDGFAAVAASSQGGASGGLGGDVDAEASRVLFFQAVLLQAACCGFVAGKLGEGHLLSGIKHTAILGVISWAVFQWGVL